eukprot:COSAG06_NODE_263_length_18879_cov_71.911555_10_plen_107_part_00
MENVETIRCHAVDDVLQELHRHKVARRVDHPIVMTSAPASAPGGGEARRREAASDLLDSGGGARSGIVCDGTHRPRKPNLGVSLMATGAFEMVQFSAASCARLSMP